MPQVNLCTGITSVVISVFIILTFRQLCILAFIKCLTNCAVYLIYEHMFLHSSVIIFITSPASMYTVPGVGTELTFTIHETTL